MAEVNGFNSVPLGRAGTGAAYVLGRTGPDALSILVSGQRAREAAAQRAAALKLRQEQDAARDLDNSLKYGTKGGALYQTGLNERAFKGLSNQLVDVERQRMAGKIDTYTAKQQQAELKRKAEDELTLSLGKQTEFQDAYKVVQGDKGRDATAFNVGYQGTLKRQNPDGTEEYLLPSEHDHLAAIQAQDNNPLTYVADEQLRRHVQGWQANTLADAHAGAIGGTHGANSLTYKGIVVDRQKDGSFAPRMENGRPVVDISQADLDRDRGGNHALDMAVKRLEIEDAQRAQAEGRAPKDALTLYKEGLANYVNFRQTESTGRNAQPHVARAAAKGTVEPPYVPPTFNGDEVRYNLPTPEVVNTPYSVPGVTGMAPIVSGVTPVETQRPDHAVYGSVQAPPVDISKAGKRTNKHVDSFVPDEYTVVGSDGKKSLRTNNRQPLAGSPGNSYGAFVDNEGKELFFKTTKEGEDAVRAGKAKLRVKFDFNQDKDEDFTASLQKTKAALLKEKNSDYTPKYPTEELAEAQARKLLKGGTVRTTHLYTPKNFKVIDGLFGDAYNKHQKALDAETRRLRAEGLQKTASKADPLGFTPKPVAAPKAATATTTHKAKANPLGF